MKQWYFEYFIMHGDFVMCAKSPDADLTVESLDDDYLRSSPYVYSICMYVTQPHPVGSSSALKEAPHPIPTCNPSI